MHRELLEINRDVMDEGSTSHDIGVMMDGELRNALRNAGRARVKMSQYVLDLTPTTDDELEAVEDAVNR